MNSSKMLLLSTIVAIGSFSIIKTKEFTPAEEIFIQTINNTIELCDKVNEDDFLDNSRQLDTLLRTLTPAQLHNILPNIINNISQKNEKVDCKICKILKKDNKKILKKVKAEISAGNGDLTIEQIMNEKNKEL